MVENDTTHVGPDVDIDAALRAFEAEERRRLGLDEVPRDHWHDPLPKTFTRKERATTTLLVSGLTMAHDYFVEGALSGVGYKVKHLDCPDTDALRYGKEFGNRGQCNPTYFTVGNLVKHLESLRAQGLSREEIVRDYVFLTAGACGPCRFGTYVTEYRKALRDSGFDGFRVLLFQQQGGIKQATGEEVGLELNAPFFVAIVKALMAGDILNLMGYRIRPYEVEAGATDAAIERCKARLYACLEGKGNLLTTLYWCRRELGRVEIDRLRVKPRVAIIGEFWAMTTEGDGNYHLQRFLESEGAEVDIQIVTAWILFMIWENVYDTRQRMALKDTDGGKKGLTGVDVPKRMASLWVAERAVRAIFQSLANLGGLHGYHLPDMDEVAAVSARFYNNEVRGGEAHMEVGKLILNAMHNKVNLTVSVKPFGCMPSSGVSDGVQTAIQERHPNALFLPIETSGDGAVNVQSRVQMQLFKARQVAEKEYQEALARWDLTEDEARSLVKTIPGLSDPLFKVPHWHGSSAADTAELVGRLRHPVRALKRSLRGLSARLGAEAAPA